MSPYLFMVFILFPSVLTEITTFTSFKGTGLNTTVFYVHDWNTADLTKALEIKDSLVRHRKDVQAVYLADWSTFSQTPDYYNVARKFTARVAQDIVKEIGVLVQGGKARHGDIELVGHGLGAHICGQVGKLWNRANEGIRKFRKIIGLNPTGPYFKDNAAECLGKGDAALVEVIHTDDRFGIYKDIGDTDLYPNTGEECTQTRLLKRNRCLHNAAQDAYIDLIEGTSRPNSTSNVTSSITMLTLDVSPSMQEHGRMISMVAASKRLINSLPNEYTIGIVVFGGEASVSLFPTNISDVSGMGRERKTIISRLPTTTTQIANTSIGAGISKSVQVVEPYLLQGNYCLDIILVTDGEENRAPFLQDVQPQLKNHCIRVHTIALGDEADVGLEDLSDQTGGRTYYASDDNSLDKLTQSLAASSTATLPPATAPISLPVKQVQIDSPEGTTFTIDEGVGRNTTFLVSTDQADAVEAELIAPDGQIFGSTNYTADTDLQQLLFKLLEVQAGNWTIKLNSLEATPRARPARSRRQAQNRTASLYVTTYSAKSEAEPVRLEAYLSSHILDYAKGKPLLIEAYLRKGLDSVVGAKVEAKVRSQAGAVIRIELLDNGSGADEEEDDGIYSRYITAPLEPGKRYQVEVTATGSPDGTTQVRSSNGDPYRMTAQDLSPLSYSFERETSAGSFRVAPSYQYRPLPPSPVKDLTVIGLDPAERSVTLNWTASGGEADLGTGSFVQIRAFTSQSPNEVEGFMFQNEHVQAGSLLPEPAGSRQEVRLQVPEGLWTEAYNGTEAGLDLYFTVRTGSQTAGLSQVSNVAPADFARPEPEVDGYFWLLITLICILILLGVVLAAVLFLFLKRRRSYATSSKL